MEKTLVSMRDECGTKMWETIGDRKPKQNKPDGIWKLNSKNMYVVKEVYGSFISEETVENEDFYQILWKLNIPSKVKDFIWRVTLDRIQTMDNLNKRHIITVEANLNCVFNNEFVESSNHLLFECKYKNLVYIKMFSNIFSLVNNSKMSWKIK